MSTSRLEKFIYAICSMDVTDLPTPLSRIEKLWNCLITGETPDFEPLSRNEKYLMAMLNYYDINDLPTPISRGEKLLYKIVVGDTDLSDVPGYLSRYEELLKNLIENGGIGGGDFEYVLYTINKSLYTLYETAEKPVKSAILTGQTLVNMLSISNTSISINKGVEYKYNITPTIGKTYLIKLKINSIGETSSAYPVKIELFSSTDKKGYLDITSSDYVVGNEIIKTITAIDGNRLQRNSIVIWCRDLTSGIFDVDITMFEYQNGMENWDIPYFEGMTSVKMPVLTTSNEDGTKTNILSTPEDLELRGIGDVQDELNLLTGELTQRVAEIVLDGSQNFELSTSNTNTLLIIFNKINTQLTNYDVCICDKLPFIANSAEDIEHMRMNLNGNVCFWIKKTKFEELNVDGVKKYLLQNPITVQYPLVTETVKTVDLSVVDQDSNPTKLGTFENITHVSLESEGLIPTLEIKVGTIISEELTSASPLMDDISVEQQNLSETVDEQSDNIDVTMMATTEIYENTL